MGKKYIVPFNMSEEEIRKNFLDWIILGDSTPIDAAYTATITGVQQSFFPFRGILAQYDADWSATSYWEHKETYEEQIPMVRYQNRNGQTYLTTEKDYGNLPSHDGLIITQRFNKTKTKERTVTDKVDRTNGSIKGTYYGKVITEENNDEGYIKWVNAIPLEDKIESAEGLALDINIKKLINTDEYAEEQIVPDIKSKAIDKCKKEIPGTRYEEFKLDNITAEFDIDLYYVPIYEVSYEYNGSNYTVTMSGSVKDSAYAVSKPVDADLEEKKRILDKEMDALKKQRLKYGLLGFLLPPGLLFIVACIGASDGFSYFMLVIEILIAVFFIGFKFIPTHKKVKAQDAVIQAYLGDLDAKRKRILAIVSNDSLTAEEQKEQIKKFIEG